MVTAMKLLINHWDIAGSPGWMPRARCHVIIGDCKAVDGHNIMKAKQFLPDGVSSSMYLADFMEFQHSGPFQDVMLKWDTTAIPPKPDEMFLILDAIDMESMPPADYTVDDLSTPIPLHDRRQGPIRCFEMFSGSMGGWSCAWAFLKQLGVESQVIALDSDLHAVFNFALTHDATIINGYRELDRFCLERFTGPVVIHADVNSKSWMAAIGEWSPELVTLSSPCIPWSTVGKSEGLSSFDGMAFAESIAACKALKPRCILSEQVPGFQQHEHFRLVLKQFNWAGYKLQWAKTLEVRHVTPVSRTRWIAMFTRIEDEVIQPSRFQMWPTVSGLTPSGCDAVLPQHMVDHLVITDDIVAMASDQNLLPPTKRIRIPASEVLDSRCVTVHEPPQTFLASYGSQHKLSSSHLREHGLLCHFLSDKGQVRWWHAIEVALLHCQVTPFHMAKDQAQAWKGVGNFISLPHSLIAILHALNAMPSRTSPQEIQEIFGRMQTCRYRVGNIHFHI